MRYNREQADTFQNIVSAAIGHAVNYEQNDVGRLSFTNPVDNVELASVQPDKDATMASVEFTKGIKADRNARPEGFRGWSPYGNTTASGVRTEDLIQNEADATDNEDAAEAEIEYRESVDEVVKNDPTRPEDSVEQADRSADLNDGTPVADNAMAAEIAGNPLPDLAEGTLKVTLDPIVLDNHVEGTKEDAQDKKVDKTTNGVVKSKQDMSKGKDTDRPADKS